MRPKSLLVLVSLCLAACGAAPSYFLLPPTAQVPRAASPVASIAVADISLPAYAEAIEIAALSETGAVALAKNALWADTPRRGLTRHLVAALQARLDAQVGAEPWPGYDPPGLRIEVITDRMIGEPGGRVQFAGQFIIVAPGIGRIVASDRFAITVPPQGAGYQGLADAHGRAVEALADQLAARIVRLSRGLV